jgi:hypothetical protein
VLVSVDPDSRELRGLAVRAGKPFELRPVEETAGKAAGPRRHVLAPADYFRDRPEEPEEWRCEQDGAPLDFLQEQAAAATTEPIFAPAITSLHTATVAIDTDNEIMANKFGNNTTTASNFIASLFASMNLIYERDVLIRLVQGTTFLRVSSTADPYVQTDTVQKLYEFATYWAANHGAVNRAVAALLSGRGGAGAAGIAGVDVLCNKSNGYSYNQLYLTGTTPSWGEILVTAHEIGHNFGSPHTHCYNPPIDTCYRFESGCYSGMTQTCPAVTTINGVTNVRGTLMSYCHLLGGCTASLVFHPTTVNLLNPKIEARVNNCIFPAILPPAVSAVTPASGPTAGGRAVTITGANFRSGAGVTFGGPAATSVVVVNGTTITAVTPAHAAGKVNVTVTNSDVTNGTLSNGFFYSPPETAVSFYTVTPCRILDTRNANGPWGGPALSANQQRTFPIAGVCGIPSAAKSVSVNVTVTGPAAGGFFSLYPGDAIPLGTSVLSFGAGQTRAASAVMRLATDGSGSLGVLNGSSGAAHLILDVNGYFQ